MAIQSLAGIIKPLRAIQDYSIPSTPQFLTDPSRIKQALDFGL